MGLGFSIQAILASARCSNRLVISTRSLIWLSFPLELISLDLSCPQHVDPDEAVQIHRLIGSKKSIGVHWGTFPLGKEHYLAPRRELHLARITQGVSESDFVCMKHGEFLLIPKHRNNHSELL